MPGLTYWLLMKKKCGRSNKKDAVACPKSCKVCSDCFVHIYRGSNHTATTCKYSCSSKVCNIEALM